MMFDIWYAISDHPRGDCEFEWLNKSRNSIFKEILSTQSWLYLVEPIIVSVVMAGV